MTDAAERAGRVRDAVLLAVLAVAVVLPGLGARDLWNPNEPIYGLAAREMAERGDWLVPTVQGREFAEKPILWFWAARAAGLVGGINEWTVRLASAASATWIVVATYLLVVPYAGRARARWSGALAATTFMVFWGGRTAQMDILVAATTVGVLLAVTRVVDHGAHPVRGWALAGLAAGLGFLAKGPVAWIVPGIAVAGWLAATRRLDVLRGIGPVVGGAVAVVVAAPWYLALAAQGRTAFLYEVLVRQNFGRFVRAWDHVEPWWYYLKYVWIDMAPWAFLVPVAAGLPGRSESERRLERLAWIWLGGTIAFFSLSDSKRSAYILPLAPAVAILAGAVVHRLAVRALPRLRRNVALALICAAAVVLGVLGAGILIEVPGRYPELALAARVLGVVMLGGAAAVATATFSRRRGPRLVPSAFVAVLVAVYAVGGAVALPAVDARKSARSFAETLDACVGDDGEVVSFGLWDWRAGYAYYARRSIDDVEDVDALRSWARGPGPRFVLVERAHRDEVEAVLGVPPAIRRAIGSNEASLFAIPPATCAPEP